MRHVPLCTLALLLVASSSRADPGSDARAALALSRPTQAPTPPQAPVSPDVKPHLPGKNCKCGCVETGRCVCKDCDHPKGADPRPPNPNCQCGCTETGKCDCKDCDHPRITPKQAVQSRRPDGGYCSPACRCGCNEGVPCQCGTSRTPQTAPQPHAHPVGHPVGYAPPVQSYPTPVVYPAYVSSSRGSGTGFGSAMFCSPRG
jgi:hypothetical protein